MTTNSKGDFLGGISQTESKLPLALPIAGLHRTRPWGTENMPKVLLQKVFPNAPGEHPHPGTFRPKSRDIPAIRCLKQRKSSPCIKFFWGQKRYHKETV